MLRDLIAWDAQLVDVMCSPPQAGRGLARGAQRVHPPLPGGTALALRVKAADGSDPASVVRHWGWQLRRELREPIPLHRTLGTEAQHLRKHVAALRGASWAPECWRDLVEVWTRLGEATGQVRQEPEEPEPRSPAALADQVPDGALVSLAEADKFWPGISGRVRTARSRHRARSARRSYVHDPDAGPAQPDGRGKYLVADLRKWHLREAPAGV